MNKSDTVKIAESLQVGIGLALAGGFMDAYTYINRGNVFATGQTGNLVLLGIRVANGNYYEAFMAFIPIMFFIFGVFTAQYLKNKMEYEEYWQSYILMFEIALLFIVGLLSSKLPNYLANASISFVSSIQFCTFRTLENSPYATVFCTGNMRSCAEKFYQGIINKDADALVASGRYCLVILTFLSGGIIAAVLSRFLFMRTIWIGCILLVIPFAKIYKTNH